MAFYGFPGETKDEALETRQFVIDNQPVIHAVELFYFVAYRHTPMVRHPEKFGITIHKQEEYDLPLDYYYTLNEPVGISCLDAMQLCEEFYKRDFHPWAVRVNAREHVFLYISKFGTNALPQIYAKQPATVGAAGSTPASAMTTAESTDRRIASPSIALPAGKGPLTAGTARP